MFAFCLLFWDWNWEYFAYWVIGTLIKTKGYAFDTFLLNNTQLFRRKYTQTTHSNSVISLFWVHILLDVHSLSQIQLPETKLLPAFSKWHTSIPIFLLSIHILVLSLQFQKYLPLGKTTLCKIYKNYTSIVSFTLGNILTLSMQSAHI